MSKQKVINAPFIDNRLKDFEEEIIKTINEFLKETPLTDAEIIGVLECIKLQIYIS